VQLEDIQTRGGIGLRKSFMGLFLAVLLVFSAWPTSNAVAAQNKWQYSNGHWYYYNANGVIQKGWLYIGQKWYYFNSAGVMQTGWVKSGNTWYFLNSSGDMRTGWLKSGNTWYNLKSSGAMQIGWGWIEGKWYYFSGSGAMKTGWVQSGAEWYFMNPSGAMATGWIQHNGQWYYLNEKGAWSPYAAEEGWEGEWKRTDLHYGGILNISDLDVASFYFEMQVSNGANTGELSGYAKVAGKKAVFLETEWGTQCKLEFTLNTDSVTVEQSDECSTVGGLGTFFNGEYVNSDLSDETPKPTLASQGIVNAAHDEKIQQLLGNDYDYLVESMQLTYEDEDLDGLGATVITGGVRGLYTIMEGAIMYDPNGYYYVAMISEDLTVKFYTNNPNYKNKLPKTIDTWREDFNDYPVEYYYKTL
jgi:hypothetical protein